MGYPFDDEAGDQEASNEFACREEAEKNGYSVEQADNCKDAELKCKSCPFDDPVKCPECNGTLIEEDYLGQIDDDKLGGLSPVNYHCKYCGHQWSDV